MSRLAQGEAARRDLEAQLLAERSDKDKVRTERDAAMQVGALGGFWHACFSGLFLCLCVHVHVGGLCVLGTYGGWWGRRATAGIRCALCFAWPHRCIQTAATELQALPRASGAGSQTSPCCAVPHARAVLSRTGPDSKFQPPGPAVARAAGAGRQPAAAGAAEAGAGAADRHGGEAHGGGCGWGLGTGQAMSMLLGPFACLSLGGRLVAEGTHGDLLGSDWGPRVLTPPEVV